MISATQLRPGMVIKFNKELFSVFKMEHRTPGNLRGFVQVKMRNFKTGTMIEHRFSSEDKVERASLDEQEMEYLYDDGEYFYFMNTETFEQMHLTKDLLGDATNFLIPQLKVNVEFYEGKADQRGTAAVRGHDSGRDRAGPEGRDGFERHQAGQAGDRTGGAGAAVHQRRREDPRFDFGIDLPRARLAGRGAGRSGTCPTARTTASSSSGNTVRKSSTRRSFSIRAMTGGVPRAQFALELRLHLPGRASSHVGSDCSGVEPPPATLLSFDQSQARERASRMRSARSRISSAVMRIMRSAGISSHRSNTR